MRVMVFDVAAESGGALSVLYDFYSQFAKNLDNQYIFVVSKPHILETSNIKALRFPWIKKSWLHRIYFDYFIAPGLIKRFKADEVLSLQNIAIPNTSIPQTIYFHNALPLSEHRFSILEAPVLWVYQNILSRSIFKSIKKSKKVIVQTKWMKKACIDMLNINADKIEVLPPMVNIKVNKSFCADNESKATFFYPASGVSFKNHNVIIDACTILKRQGITEYNVILTLKGNENKHIVELYNRVNEEGLPVSFIGSLSMEAVFEYYTKSVLIFQSYIETVGLPLLEAKMHSTPIIASDCDFSHEILDGYANVLFFKPFDKERLAELMLKSMVTIGAVS